MLQSTATGRWATTTRAIVENLKILTKMDDFSGFFNFVSFSALKKMDGLEKDEVDPRTTRL